MINSLGHQEGIPQHVKAISLTEQDGKRKGPVSGNKKWACNAPIKLGMGLMEDNQKSLHFKDPIMDSDFTSEKLL